MFLVLFLLGSFVVISKHCHYNQIYSYLQSIKFMFKHELSLRVWGLVLLRLLSLKGQEEEERS